MLGEGEILRKYYLDVVLRFALLLVGLWAFEGVPLAFPCGAIREGPKIVIFLRDIKWCMGNKKEKSKSVLTLITKRWFHTYAFSLGMH